MSDVGSTGQDFDVRLQSIAKDNGAMAALRRGVGRSLEEAPQSWPYVYALAPKNDERSELATHLTLGLYALHHQSKTPNIFNQSEERLGVAVGKLKRKRQDANRSGEAVEKRFKIILSAATFEALSVHLRGLIMLMRDSDVSLDYAQLREDLTDWLVQDWRGRVCLSWARDYYQESSAKSDK
jgi:CRISPR system Cascade subunit CasB